MLKPFAAFVALGVMAACSAAASTEAAMPLQAAPAVTPPQIVAAAPQAMVAATPQASAAHVSSVAIERPAFSCDVRVRPTANGVLIEPVVRSDANMAGSYSLSIVQSGANSSEIQQGGDFTADAGSTVTLGQSEIGASGASRGHVRLRVQDENGVSCSRTVRL